MKLTPYRTLVYFDLPEVILCHDIFGTKHLCTRVIIDEEADKDNYYSVAITGARIKDLLEGHLDLRTCLLHPEKREWTVLELTEAGELETVQSSGEVSKDLLPLEGFQMGGMSYSDEEILLETAQHDTTMWHVSLSPKSGGNEIDLEALSDISKLLQAIVKHMAKKIASFNRDLRNAFRGYEGRFSAVAVNTGSFKLHLKSQNTEKDLIGGTKSDVVLEHLDNLLRERSSAEEIIKAFRPYHGHAISAFNNLVEVLNKYEVGVKYSWSSPASQVVHRMVADRAYLSHVSTVLRKATDLPPVEKVFVGKLENIGLTRWKVFDEDSQEHVTGKVNQEGQLDGLKFHSTLYRLFCEERIQELEINESEKKAYVLMRIEEVN